jgi:serine/threonine protein kinase
MNTEPIVNRCPKCQALLPTNAPKGLCVKCLLVAVSTPTEAGQSADRQPPPPIESVAAAFPQLEILELIGHGGMGVVYKARQPRLDRLVALKLLPQSLAADAAFAERFNREARVLARLNHPNIVTVHDFGQSGGFFYLLMEFVDGVNLRQAMRAGRFTPQQAMMLVPKICEALQFAHDEGILHRDIKPENILLDTKGRVKIADFGIAKLLGEAREKVTLTGSGQAVGTPHYMAPEQLEHPQDVDQRADIYSLGVVFYEMLTGELPIGRFAPPSQKSDVDARVDDVVFHALEKEREKRFRSAGEVKTSVEAITSNAPATPAQAEPPHPSPNVPERRIPCHISTPEHLSTFTGQVLCIYTGKGELRLDAQNLTFVSNWQSTVIPLQDIHELGIGNYSRLAKPVRLDYLAVTFEQAGQRRTLFFTPSLRGGLSLPWEVNPCVAECLQAVREAVIARTGQPPTGPSSAELPHPNSLEALWPIIKLGLPACAVGAGLALAIELSRKPATRVIGSASSWAWPLLTGCAVLVCLAALGLLSERKRKGLALRHGTVASPATPNPTPSPGGAESRATCYFNTPSRMRDCLPSTAARIFTCKGEVLLDAEKLTFTSPWRTTITIPLKHIEDLSVGQFQMWTTPWVMKYARISFLSVTFRQEGLLQTVLLTPVEVGAASAGQIIDCVGRWFERVRQAASQCTGALPHASEPDLVTVSAEPAWNRKTLPLLVGCLLVAIATGVFHAHMVSGPIRFATLLATCWLVMAIIWFAVGFMRANSALWHGDLNAVTSDDPPAPEPVIHGDTAFGPGRKAGARWWNASYVALAVTGLTTALLLGFWGYADRFTAASGGNATGVPSASESAGQFVLYTMPAPGQSQTVPGLWNFKCLLPAEHLVHLLFIRWTNGVPTVDPAVSAYFKVGQAPIDKQFFLFYWPPDDSAPAGATNDIRWDVHLVGPVQSIALLPGEPPYRPLETPAILNVRSAHQGVLRLVDYVTPAGQTRHGRSGIELRIFVEPWKQPLARTSPLEVEGANYVAGNGTGWTTEQALNAIKQWPIDP